MTDEEIRQIAIANGVDLHRLKVQHSNPTTRSVAYIGTMWCNSRNGTIWIFNWNEDDFFFWELFWPSKDKKIMVDCELDKVPGWD